MVVIALNFHAKHPPPPYERARLHKKHTSVLFYIWRLFFMIMIMIMIMQAAACSIGIAIC